MAKKFSDYIIPGLLEAAVFGGLIHAFSQQPINWGTVVILVGIAYLIWKNK